MIEKNKPQQQMNSQVPVMLSMMPPEQFKASQLSLVQSEHFPDILQFVSNDQARGLIESLAQLNTISLTNKQGASRGYTALHWICVRNELDLIQLLLNKCKPDVNIPASLGEIALFICIKNCNLNAIEILIESGSDLSHRDVYNRSISHWCAYTGKVVILYYFQKYHSIHSINDIDQFLQNPLHIASASGFQELIVYLLERSDIDITAQDYNGNTALHLAAKCGLARICWMISQHNKGNGVQLVGITNKQNQLPYDLIKNERGPNYKKIRDWLRLEAKTNNFLISKANADLNSSVFDDKKSLLKIKKGTTCFNWSSDMKLKAELTFRSSCLFFAITIPLMINRFVMPQGLSLLKGFFGYPVTFGLILMLMIRQRHRIDHISGKQNPYFTFFFGAVFVHNYLLFYSTIFGPFNILSFYDLFMVSLTLAHIYSFYKIIVADPGFCGPRESFKKPDGTHYELRDLMKMNVKDNDISLGWLQADSRPDKRNLYFCETCLIVQSSPAKHCKLCEKCCLKFDHHCLYISKCVGLKNHCYFMNFLISTIVCIIMSVHAIACYLYQVDTEIAMANLARAPNDQHTLLYYMFASDTHIWLGIMTGINCFSIFGITFLFLFQLRSISLGFTSQFFAPAHFTQISPHMQKPLNAIMHRIYNLYVFFFKSFEESDKLYFRQIREYNECQLTMPNRHSSHDLRGHYPRDNFNDLTDNFIPSTSSVLASGGGGGFSNSNTFPINGVGNRNDIAKEIKHYEIELD